MAGTSPAMTVQAGFIQGGSVDGRCETRNGREIQLSVFTRIALTAMQFHSGVHVLESRIA
jgi:hypothetical protein